MIIDNPKPKIDEVEVCKDRAFQKLTTFNDKSVNKIESFRLVDLDARAFNPSHYAWYEMEMTIDGVEKTARTLVQLDRISGKCI